MTAPTISIKWVTNLTALEKAWKRKAARVMHRTGGYGRAAMRRLFRTSKKPSAPGEPPRSHPPHNLKNLTLYGYDAWSQSVVIGPRKIVPKVKQTGPPVPAILSAGGTVRRRFTIRKTGRHIDQTATHKPRPYKPRAYAAARAHLLKLLADTPL